MTARMLKLTQAHHPDFPGDRVVYIDPSHIMTIALSHYSPSKLKSEQAHREALDCLRDEVQRVADEASALHPKTMAPQDEKEAQAINQWATAKEAAGALQAAYSMVARAATGPAYHEPIACTELQLSCGTAFEHGVMLSRWYVAESPDRVAAMRDYALGNYAEVKQP